MMTVKRIAFILFIVALMGIAGAIEDPAHAATSPKPHGCATVYNHYMHATTNHTRLAYWVMGWQTGCFHND